MSTEPISAIKKMEVHYETIHAFFDAFSLPHSRRYLLSAIKATERNRVWKKASPADLLYFFEKLHELLFAAFAISTSGYKRDKVLLSIDSIPDPAQIKLYTGWCRKYGPWDYFPSSLSTKEYNDPYRALKKCIKWSDKKQWKDTLGNILNYALSANTMSETGTKIEILQTTLLLQKMLEACHLIDVRLNGE